MQGLWSWNQYLKVSNYIKTCSTRFPGAQCLTPPWIPLEGNWRSATAAGQGSVSREADDNCCCCSVSGKCSWQAPIYSWQLRCGFEEKHSRVWAISEGESNPRVVCSYFVVVHSLWPRGRQHTRLLCPLPSPRVCSNSHPSSWWCHPTISSSVASLIFPRTLVFSNSQLFTPGSQSIGVSAISTVFPMIIQSWFPLGLTGLISLLSKGLSRVFSNPTVQKHQFFGTQLSLWSNAHIHTWLLENHSWLYGPLLTKSHLCLLICCLGFSQFSLSLSKYLSTSWLHWFWSPRI